MLYRLHFAVQESKEDNVIMAVIIIRSGRSFQQFQQTLMGADIVSLSFNRSHQLSVISI